MRFSPFSSALCLGLAACALAWPSVARAQRYLLKNGQALTAAEVTLGPGYLVQQVASGANSFERRYPFSDLARLEFPEPEALEQAAQALTAGRGPEALVLVEPVFRQFAPFASVPGSYWPRAAQLRLEALLLGKDEAAIATAARELMQAGLDPELTGTAKLALAQLDARAGRESLAVAMLEEIVKDAPPAVQARAWLLRGDLAAARAAHEEALEAYLRVPAFFGTEDALLPAALLGSARAYRGFGDADRAERAALELLDNYPDTAQAALAKTEFNL
jgi:hypothetical protein